MSTNANEPEQESDDQHPVDSRADSAREGGENTGSPMMQIPAEVLANLPPEVLENLSPEIQAQLQQGSGEGEFVMRQFSTSMSMMLGNIVNPIASRITSQHITDIIRITGRRSEHEHDDRKESRRLSFALVIVTILAVVAVIVFLTIYRQGGLLGYILSGIGGLIAGAFGGYGYANRPR